jgi:hypothetical protein
MKGVEPDQNPATSSAKQQSQTLGAAKASAAVLPYRREKAARTRSESARFHSKTRLFLRAAHRKPELPLVE